MSVIWEIREIREEILRNRALEGTMERKRCRQEMQQTLCRG